MSKLFENLSSTCHQLLYKKHQFKLFVYLFWPGELQIQYHAGGEERSRYELLGISDPSLQACSGFLVRERERGCAGNEYTWLL